MNEIGFAGGALLAGMVALRKFVGLADQFEIIVRAVLAHVAQQLAELGDREHVGRDLFAQGGHWVFLIISGWASRLRRADSRGRLSPRGLGRSRMLGAWREFLLAGLRG